MHSVAFGFHSYVIYTIKRLHAQSKRFVIVHYHDSKSLAEDYFSARPVEEEDQEIDSVVDFDFSEYDAL